MLEPGLTSNTISKSLLDDLKLFADFMMNRLGHDYFLYATRDACRAVRNTANALCGNCDWRVVAGLMLSEGRVEDFH
jgi:hypothetical protein